MLTAEEIPHGRPKQHFVSEECLQVWRLFKPLMPGNIRADFGTEEESHLLLGEAGALAVRAYIIW